MTLYFLETMSTIPKQPLWLPAKPQETNAGKFIAYVNKKRSIKLNSYDDLYRWSVSNSTLSDFWADVYTFLHLAPRHHGSVGRVLDEQVCI